MISINTTVFEKFNCDEPNVAQRWSTWLKGLELYFAIQETRAEKKFNYIAISRWKSSTRNLLHD
jgi:hypothetical protein